MTEERLVGVFTVLFTLIMEDGRGHVNCTFCWSKLSKYFAVVKEQM